MNLDYTAETEYLGIHITETLNWNSHIQSLASKLSKVSFMIKSLREFESKYNTKYLFYKISVTSMCWYIILGAIGE